MLQKLISILPFSFIRWLLRKEVFGANYHLVSDVQIPYVWPIWKYQTPQKFKEDLRFLQKNFNLISYQNYQEGKYSNRSLLLSFDDGYKELFTEVYPILKEMKIPTIFFLTTSILENKNLLTRNKVALLINYINEHESALSLANQVLNKKFKDKTELISFIKPWDYTENKQIDLLLDTFAIDTQKFLQTEKPFLTEEQIHILNQDPLITLGAHSVNHIKMNQLTPEEIKKEIVNSVNEIKMISKESKIPFAFPYTSYGLDRSLLKEIQEDSSNVGDYFGEWSDQPREDIVLKRFSLDTPLKSSKEQMESLMRSRAYAKIKKIVNQWIR